MSAVGIGVGRDALTIAVLDGTGVPQALALGEGPGGLQRSLATAGESGAATAITVLSHTPRPTWSMAATATETETELGSGPLRLLGQALVEAQGWAQSSGRTASIMVALDSDATFTATQVWDAAARTQVALTAVINAETALGHYLSWWLPAEVHHCRVLIVRPDAQCRSGQLVRLGDGRGDLEVRDSVRLTALEQLQQLLLEAVGTRLGPSPELSMAALQLACRQLLQDALAGAGAARSLGSSTCLLRGKEVQLQLPEAGLNRLLQALIELLQDELASDTRQASPLLLLSPLLGDEMRLRLLDQVLSATLYLPRNAEAALAYGAALHRGTAVVPSSPGSALHGVLGVYVSDRRDAAKRRFVELLQASTALPVAATRSFFARSNHSGRLLFDLAWRSDGNEQAVGQVVVAVPVPPGPSAADSAVEVQLTVRIVDGGGCLYSVCDSTGTVFVSGVAGRVHGPGESDDGSGEATAEDL